jgi:hypothetical protein
MSFHRPGQTTADRGTRWVPRSALLATLLALATLVVPSVAAARGGGGDDVRVTASCGRGASAELRLKSDHGAIEVEYRVRRGRSGERWGITLVHERRVAWRGGATSDGGGFRIRRTLPEFAGADEITARAVNARGLTCQATGVLHA